MTSEWSVHIRTEWRFLYLCMVLMDIMVDYEGWNRSKYFALLFLYFWLKLNHSISAKYLSYRPWNYLSLENELNQKISEEVMNFQSYLKYHGNRTMPSVNQLLDVVSDPGSHRHKQIPVCSNTGPFTWARDTVWPTGWSIYKNNKVRVRCIVMSQA